MLEAVREGSARRAVPVPETRTRDDGVTGLLLGVLDGIDRHDGRILEAEERGDDELAGFLRELRRQDLVRARGATRLLRRPHEDVRERR